MQFIIGDGAHARCLAALTGVACLGPGDAVPAGAELYIGVGLPSLRRNIYEKYRDGHVFPPINLTGRATDTFSIADAVHLMPGSIVMPGVQVGTNVLVNTGAQIDHDCVIGAHSVISPGAVLCGNVTLGDACHIGAGAIIVQRIKLNAETFVPAGTLVCGPGDFRKPIRMVQHDRADAADVLAREFG